MTIELIASPAGGLRFFGDPTCAQEIAHVVVQVHTSSTLVYVRGAVIGPTRITPTVTSVLSGPGIGALVDVQNCDVSRCNDCSDGCCQPSCSRDDPGGNCILTCDSGACPSLRIATKTEQRAMLNVLGTARV